MEELDVVEVPYYVLVLAGLAGVGCFAIGLFAYKVVQTAREKASQRKKAA